ncbi:Alpha/Beta hydrolase protein [Exophiala viscosa]|uniref:Alpha/Beta hydrolase protein n=1 Tax=Exophiala viscosa TaxID=2486360 RepID=UPI002191BBEC|nr:Alpha/Beta hydrolase protein [Exophiala viscosa]
MSLFKSVLFTLLLAVVEAATIAKNAYNCTSFIVHVPVNNVTVVVPPIPPFTDQHTATSFANLITEDLTLPQDASGAPNLSTLTTTFNISAEYCTPAKPGPKASTLQILTHGLGFNRTYWDFYLPSAPNNAQYSYINTATGAGYSTLSWNRLGHPPTTVANPYTQIQAPVELAVLAGLTTLVRAGNVTQVPVPQKVIHVGHSWGSILSNALAATAPTLSDGVVLTGYSHQVIFNALFIASTGLRFINQNQPARFPNSTYSTGFLTWPDKYANQYSFLEYPYFDDNVLNYGESGKWPFTLGEFLSAALVPLQAPSFKGPVLYLAAEADLIFCASNCTTFFGPTSAEVTAFNGSSSVETYIQPNVGHGINLHYNATGAYNVVMNWASRHGF